jgi:histidine triad (HIT) family protein
MTAYDNQNIFSKILRGEMPSINVYEDDMTFAFMDIMPKVDGHVLVLPKAASRNILDIKLDDLHAVIATAQKIAIAQMRAFSADGITIHQLSESAGGQVVFYTHIHVLPRHDRIALRTPTKMATSTALELHAEKIRSALKPVTLS